MIINPYIYSTPLRHKNGNLYNFFAAINENLCPTDCHVPTQTEWTTLIAAIGGSTYGGLLKEAGIFHWTPPNTGATNATGFTALPSGWRYNNGTFTEMGLTAIYWTVDEYNSTDGRYSGYLRYNNANIGSANFDKNRGLSIRLIYTGENTTVTDYDNNVYDVITIGSQKWLKQNFKCTHLNNGNAIPNITVAATWEILTTLAMCAYNNDENNV